MVWPLQLMIILTTILSLFSDWRSHKASQTEVAVDLFRAKLCTSFPRLCSPQHMSRLAAANMVKQDEESWSRDSGQPDIPALFL